MASRGACYLAFGVLAVALLLIQSAAADLLVSVGGYGKIYRFGEANGNFLGTMPSSSEGGAGQIAIAPDGSIYHTCLNLYPGVRLVGQIDHFDGRTGSRIGSVPLTLDYGFGFGIVATSTGSILVSSQTDFDSLAVPGVLVYKGSPSGYSVFIPIGRGGLINPGKLLFGPDGMLYVEDAGAGVIRRYDGQGNYQATIATGGHFAFGPDHLMYVLRSSADGGGIVRYDTSTATFLDVFISNGSPGFGAHGDLTFGPDGNLYLSSYSPPSVFRYSSSGQLIGSFLQSTSVFEDSGWPISLGFAPLPEPHMIAWMPLALLLRRKEGLKR